MPSRANSTTTKPTALVSTSSKRFELPALEFKFASLTDGTDIPPPLPSPTETSVPTPPETPKGENGNKEKAKPAQLKVANGKSDLASPESNVSNSSTGTKRRAEDHPASPTLSSRPGSIRRLFSRNLLNAAYTNGEEPAAEGGTRPTSRSASSVADPKKAKRSSGWFSRLRSNDSKHASTPLSPTSPPAEGRKSMGPPPPMIPELSELKSKLDHEQDLSFGNDLFKNIK